MKTKILLIFSIIILIITVIILSTQKNRFQTPENDNSIGFTTKPLEECVVCIQGKSWDSKPCCSDNFDTKCTAKDGVVRKSDLHPFFNSILKGCFQKASDAGKECAEDKECLSGVCNLEQAIQSEKCSLIEKTPTGEKNLYSDVEFYTAKYFCGNSKPGICTETINDSLNTGGLSHTFKMEGNTLVEILDSGPIY